MAIMKHHTQITSVHTYQIVVYIPKFSGFIFYSQPQTGERQERSYCLLWQTYVNQIKGGVTNLGVPCLEEQLGLVG